MTLLSVFHTLFWIPCYKLCSREVTCSPRYWRIRAPGLDLDALDSIIDESCLEDDDAAAVGAAASSDMLDRLDSLGDDLEAAEVRERHALDDNILDALEDLGQRRQPRPVPGPTLTYGCVPPC